MSSVEGSFFSGRPLDFLFFTVFGIFMFFIYALKYSTLFFGSMLASYFIYYDSKRTPDNRVFFIGIPFPVQHSYLPFIFLAMDFLNGASFKSELYAFAVSHLFYFIHDVINIKYDKSFLYLPDAANRFVMKMFE